MEKEFRDKQSMMKVLNLLFVKIPVFLQIGEEKYPIKTLSLKENGVIVATPRPLEGSTRTLSLTHSGNKFVGHFNVIGSDGKTIELLAPNKIIISAATREDEREKINSKELFITNVINQNDIYKFMGYETEKVDAIVKKNIAILKKDFPNCKAYLSARQDGRLRIMNSFDRPIFIPDIKIPNLQVGNEFVPIPEFKKFLDANGLLERNTAEICVPIYYKNYIQLGYLQILSDHPLDINVFNYMKTISNNIVNDLISSGIFQESKEICEVVDIGSGGISFFHPPSALYTRSFAIGEYILFDLNLPNFGIVTIRTIIKNIKNQEKLFRVGCQLYNLNQKDLITYNEYLMSISETSPEPEEAKEPEEIKSKGEQNIG